MGYVLSCNEYGVYSIMRLCLLKIESTLVRVWAGRAFSGVSSYSCLFLHAYTVSALD